MKLAALALRNAVKKFKSAKSDATKQKIAVTFFEKEAEIVHSEMIRYMREVEGK